MSTLVGSTSKARNFFLHLISAISPDSILPTTLCQEIASMCPYEIEAKWWHMRTHMPKFLPTFNVANSTAHITNKLSTIVAGGFRYTTNTKIYKSLVNKKTLNDRHNLSPLNRFTHITLCSITSVHRLRTVVRTHWFDRRISL